MELLVRIERRLGVTLPEKKFADAETPRNLWQAIINAGPSIVSVAAMEIMAAQMSEVHDLPHSSGHW